MRRTGVQSGAKNGRKSVKMKKFLLLGLLGACLNVAASESQVLNIFKKQYPHLSESVWVGETEIKGIYEVRFGGQKGYTDAKVSFLMVGGSLINTKTLEDVSVKQEVVYQKALLKQLPLEHAVKNVYGKGERLIIAFENPDCANCKKLGQIFASDEARLNATVYTFIVPVERFSDSRRKAQYVYCSDNPAQVWKSWMRWDGNLKSTPIPLALDAQGKVQVDGTGNPILSPEAKVNCDNAKSVDVALQLYRQRGYDSTPRLVFKDGSQVRGWQTLDELDQIFKKVDVIK